MATQDWKEITWRDATPRASEFLGTWDIPELFEGSRRKLVTIKKFDLLDAINGKKQKVIIMYVEEYAKGIALNHTNKKILSDLYNSVRVKHWTAGKQVNLYAKRNTGRIGERIGIAIELLEGEGLLTLWATFNSAQTLKEKREAANAISRKYPNGKERDDVLERLRTEIELFKEQNPNE